MSVGAFAGTWALVRINLRRDRLVVPTCVAGFTALLALTAASLDDLYPTAGDRRQLASAIGENPAISAIRGAPQGLDTLGGLVTFQAGVLVTVFVALMSLLLVNRHTRSDEEAGRTELVLSTATGRCAPAAAGLLTVAVADAGVAIGIATALIASGLPAAGSAALAAWIGAAGLTFAAVATVSAQLSENSRTASGTSLAVLGAAYATRAAGDAGDGALTWFSPIGWGEKVRAFDDERWWPLLLYAAATVLLVGLAYTLLGRRDLGAGILPSRGGPAAASARLGGPLGLAVRLQRGALIGWGVGLLLLGGLYGVVADAIESFAENERIAEILAQAGGIDIVDSYFGTIVVVLALLASGFAIASALRARAEEAAGRAEAVLAAPTTRARWSGGHLAVALGGTALVLALAGLGAGAGAAISTGELVNLPRLLGSALAQAPAVWAVVGLAFALFGLMPRAIPAAWVAFGVFVVVEMFGELLDLPRWVRDLSPFEHLPEAPAAELTVAPPVILTAVAAALVLAGFAGLRRRDIGAG